MLYKNGLRVSIKTLPEYKVAANEELNSVPKLAKNKSDWHERRFVAEIWFRGDLLGKGYGRSKKASEQAAAKAAFLQIKDSASDESVNR